MINKKRLGLVCLLLLFAVSATGCVFGPKEDAGVQGIDPPQIDYTAGQEADIVFNLLETEGEAEEQGDQDREVIQEGERTIYVFDHQGYVVPITISVPKTESVAKQALEYMVVDGPISNKLPEGMRAVLPAGTEIDVNVTSSGTAIVDFSKEFETYDAKDEKGILEAVTWTLTQFETIDEVVFWINGYPQEVMPINGTPIGKSISRKDGINIELDGNAYIGNNSTVILYFKAQSPSGNYEYFVPVTRLIAKKQDIVSATMSELLAGPRRDSGLFSELPRVQLLEANVNGKQAVINFGEQLLPDASSSEQTPEISLESVVFSLTETGLVDQVQFLVEGQKNMLTHAGQDFAQPVSRPFSINVAGF